MRRRDFITLLGAAAAAWPLAAGAQTKRPLVAVLVMNGRASVQSRVRGFLDALGQAGYREGRDFTLAERYADGLQDALPALADELARLKPDVLVAGSVPATFAAKQASAVTPIVCIGLIDPVALGLVASEARPAGQVTGILTTIDGLIGKQLELAREAIPGIARVGILMNPGDPGEPILMQDARASAAKLGLSVFPVEARVPNDLDDAFKGLVRERVDMVVTLSDTLFLREQQRITILAAVARLPTMFPQRESVDAGGLMSYGVSLGGSWRRAAYYVDKILMGTKAGDIPVELPTKYELVINLKTAKALSLDIAASLLLRADEVIE
jgi:putative ABC transport system substrate-binding protein